MSTSATKVVFISCMAATVSFSPPSFSIVNHRYAAPKKARAHQLHLRPLFSLNSNEDTENLLERARRLRQEISAIESSKVEIQREIDLKDRARQVADMEMKVQKDNLRMRYSAVVPILKDMGEEVMERVDFPPRLKGGKSRIVTVQASLPLGLVLGEETSRPGITSVDEVALTGNGESAGVKKGDIVRAVTACQTTMETPTWQLLAGGIGQPKTKRFMYSADGRPLEEVLNAISEQQDGCSRERCMVGVGKDGLNNIRRNIDLNAFKHLNGVIFEVIVRVQQHFRTSSWSIP